MINLKDGVVAWGLSKEVWIAIEKTYTLILTAPYLKQRIFTITSCRDGVHKDGSLHYKGEAFDFRTWYWRKEEVGKLVLDLMRELGSDYDVVLERDHCHVEYDRDR